MIIYVDSSVLARAYLSDESGHEEALALLESPDVGLVTGTWSRIEVVGALIRATRGGRVKSERIVQLLESDLGPNGLVTLIAGDQLEVESKALELVREFGVRAMDAWHLATASLIVPGLLEAEEVAGFATRDDEQAAVAVALGFHLV